MTNTGATMMAALPPRLLTDRLLLRTATTADAPGIARYLTENRDFHTPWDPVRTEEYFTAAYWEEQTQRDAKIWQSGAALRLFLFRQDEPERVQGAVTLSNIVRGPAQFCYVGYALAEQAQGQGLMYEAMTAVGTFAFAELNLHRLMANYMPRNERSGRLLRRLGFVVEGYARDYLFLNGRWEDHILTALVNPEEAAP